MSSIPNNPNKADHKSSQTDTSINESFAGGGTTYMNPAEKPMAIGTGNPIVSRADGALWDTVAGAYIAIQNTNIGTTVCSKNGQ